MAEGLEYGLILNVNSWLPYDIKKKSSQKLSGIVDLVVGGSIVAPNKCLKDLYTVICLSFLISIYTVTVI